MLRQYLKPHVKTFTSTRIFKGQKLLKPWHKGKPDVCSPWGHTPLVGSLSVLYGTAVHPTCEEWPLTPHTYS